MAKHRGPGEPDDAFLGALLREEGDRYAPDAARIRSRIDAGLARGAERTAPARIRLVPPLAVAGAVAATLVGVVLLVQRSPDGAAPNLTRTVIAASTSTSDGSAPATSGHPLTPPPSTTARPPTRTTKPATSTATRAIATTVAGLPSQLTLPASGGEIRDWVVLGARSDGTVIRQKNGAGLIAAPALVSGAAEPTDAPIDVLWRGGIPEQDRAVNGTWWTAPSGPTVFRLRIGPVDRPGRVTLYLGAEGTTVQVRATVDGLSGTGTSASVSPGAKAAVTIELERPAVGHTVTIEIGAGDSTTDGTISLAAVALR